jgi:ribose transport system permease protein
MSATSIVKKIRKPKNLVEFMPIITLVGLMIVMAIGSPRFLVPSNLHGLLTQSSILLVMGLGETFIILLGSIDLSIAPIAAMSTIIAAMLIPSLGYFAYVVAVIYGVFAGLLTGLVHTKARIPSFIATLGALGLWTGVGFVLSKATPITVVAGDIHYTRWVTGTTLGLNNVIYLAATALLIAFIIERYTQFGRYVKAIGAGERASSVSGVAIDRYKTMAFMLSATMAAFSGVLLSARMAGGSARMADGMQMKAIAVVVLGGTAISGGIGGVMRTLVGVLIVIALDTGMTMAGVNPWFQQAVYGAIVIMAVALTIDRSRITIIK